MNSLDNRRLGGGGPTTATQFLDRLLDPGMFLVGVIGAFLICCVLGRMIAKDTTFEPFQRFHHFISNQTHFSPTATQVMGLCRSRLPREKVAVIIGGNSVFFGTGQRVEHIWTRDLQDRLGPQFQVLNLARVGATPNEFASVAAEMTSRFHDRLIYVTPILPAQGVVARPFDTTYSPLFWDAYYQGLLQPDPERERAIDLFRKAAYQMSETQPKLAEKDRSYQADALLRFQDLWQSCSYKYFSTVYLPSMGAQSFRPRRTFPDPECPPVPRYPDSLRNDAMKRLRLAVKAVRWVPEWANNLATSLSPAVGNRTLAVLVRDSPYFMKELSAEDRSAYEAFYPAMVSELAMHGFASVTMGTHYTHHDFADHCHLAENGGMKLAEQVAPAVDDLARKLGYLNEKSQ